MENFLIGTSGYDYPEWKGVFYPQDLKRKDFLSYYSTVFNALEINNSFYNMPDKNRILSFYERTEGKVQFSIKANRLLTHEIDLQWKNKAEDFKQAIIPLQEKDCLSAILFQFPQSFHYTPENRIYLSQIINYFSGFPVVIEFRHKEWIKESVFEGLVKLNASLAFCDVPPLRALPQIDSTLKKATCFIGPNAYIRLHGRNENAWYCNDGSQNGSSRYDYNYSKEELELLKPIFEAAILEGKKVQIFFNNHPRGSSALNASDLRQMMK